jgi:hypothetical protein
MSASLEENDLGEHLLRSKHLVVVLSMDKESFSMLLIATDRSKRCWSVQGSGNSTIQRN